MAHTLYRATLALHTPLGTPLAGDTLFGQLCWTLREQQGEAELERRLTGYLGGQPWLVVSDGFPSGYLPAPTLPSVYRAQSNDPQQRKAEKKRRWIAVQLSKQPLAQLLAAAQPDSEAYSQSKPAAASSRRAPSAPHRRMQWHNTLNRLSGATGNDDFAPYAMAQTFHAPGQEIDLYFALDSQRSSPDDLAQLLASMGATGFGRDAGVGLGKFSLQSLQTAHFAAPANANAYWTLAPSAPQGQDFAGERSFWRVLTRFGRHGNTLATSGKPFKTPLLLAATGAVLRPAGDFAPRLFVGQGLGGNGQLSKAEPATVHQGYAPVVPIFLEEPR